MNDHRERVTLPGQEARQGRIVLDTPAKRAIFLSGLIGAVLLVALGVWLS